MKKAKLPYGFGHPKYIRKHIRQGIKRVDSDRDKVPDWKDCKPLNPKFQHISKTMRERVYQQPIYMKSTEEEEGMYHIGYEGMPKSLKKERQKVLSIMSQRPDIIGEIERKKPKTVAFVRGGMAQDELGYEQKGHVRVRTTLPKSKGLHHEKEVFEEAGYRTPEAQVIGTATIHELEHVRQRKSYHGKRYKKLFKGRYSQQKGERMAQHKEAIMGRKRYKYPTQEEYEEDVESFMEREFD